MVHNFLLLVFVEIFVNETKNLRLLINILIVSMVMSDLFYSIFLFPK